jgi:hypothetical protein
MAPTLRERVFKNIRGEVWSGWTRNGEGCFWLFRYGRGYFEFYLSKARAIEECRKF